ncbi:22773_t:CDS:2 [Rhizophagus irregularis]|nr:22773_t:CDS:2 [Rhizophagus irregularis]
MKSFKKIFNSNNEDENNSTMEKRNLWKSPNINYQDIAVDHKRCFLNHM